MVLCLAAGLSAVGHARVAPAVPATSAPPRVAGGVNLGSSLELTFASRPAAERARIMRHVMASGATWIRIALPMPGDEYAKGHFTWYSDTEVRAAPAAGLHVDGLIGFPAPWARNTDGSPDIADMATFAARAARHYSAMGVTTFEIWNEPNSAGAWGGRPVDIRAYAGLLERIYPVIKRRDPHDTVMIGGLAPVGTAADRMTYSPYDFLRDLFAAGVGHSFDAVGLHP